MDNIETWRPVVGYEGLYEVSDWGRVRSLDRYVNNRYLKGVIMKQRKNKFGYMRVTLHKNSKAVNFSVHRLVAQAFLPNPDNLPQVNHKDENKENNRVDNLEWCNCEYNTNYGTGIKRRAKTQTNNSRSKIVYMYNEGGLCGMWPSTRECARNGFNQKHVSECCLGKYTQHKGFKWSYEPPKPLLALPYYP